MRSLFLRHRFLIAFATLSSVMGASVGLAKVTTSLYAVQLGAHEGLLALIAAAQSVGVLIMSLPLGFLVERHGPARLFVLGTVIAGTLYAAVPLVPTAAFLLLCTTAIGFFMPFRFISLNTVFFQQLLVLGESKAGWYRGTHMAGMFLLGPLLAAIVIERWLFAGAYWLIAASFAFTVLLSPIVFGQYRDHERADHPFRWSELAARAASLMRDPELRRVSVVEFGAQAINAYYTFFIVVIGVTSLGLGKPDAASLVAVQGAAYVVALIALGGAAARWGALRVQQASCTALAISLLVLGFGQQLALLWFGALLLGAGLGLLQIVNLTQFARIGERIGRGKTAGMAALVGPAGGFCGSLCGGAIGRGLGLQTVFLLFVPAVALLCWQISQPLHEAPLESGVGQ